MTAAFATLVALIWGTVLVRLGYAAMSMHTSQGSFLVRLYTVLGVVTFSVLLYLFPVISRFRITAGKAISLAFVMAGRYIGYTLLMTASAAILIILYIYYIPLLLILVIPSIWMLYTSFFIEKVLRKYMPGPEGDDRYKWYYE